MARAKRPHSGASQSRKKTSVLDRLKPEEAASVLRSLLEAHPALGATAEQIARSLLREVSFECVAEEVEAGVGFVDLDDLNSRAGSHRWGYVDPSEAAWELLEEAVAPFLEDMKRQMELGLEAEALEICKGVVLGLYRLRGVTDHAVLGWAPDFPAETAAHAVETWCTGGDSKADAQRKPRKRPAFPQRFVDEYVPEWHSLIAQALSRR